MAKCLLCGKRGLFLALDKNGLCPACVEDQAKKRAAAARKKTERIRVAGTSYRQKEIEELGEDNPVYSLSVGELREDYEDERVFALFFDDKVDLVPEPENEHDKNAIRVEADGVLIGYVPKSKTKRVRELLASPGFRSVSLEIWGGKYKRAREGEPLEKGETDFRAELEFKYEEVAKV